MKKISVDNVGVEVSVIIANRNTGIFLPRLLKSLLVEKGRYEIIIVDDASTDNSVEVISRFAQKSGLIKLITLKEHGGAAKARNVGAEASSGRFLFFLDSDTKVKQGWFREIGKFFLRHPDTGIAIAKLLKMGTNRFDSAGELTSPFCFLVERARGAVDTGQFDREDRIFSGKSAAIVIRRDVFEKIYGFDESYVIFLEDTDLCWRAQLYGYQVLFLPRVTVWHAYWTAEKPFVHYIQNRVYYHGCRNTIMTVIKNLGWRRLICILPAQYLVWLIMALANILRGRSGPGLEILSGLVWTLTHKGFIISKRVLVQRARTIGDGEIFTNVGFRPPSRYYLEKARAYSGGVAY